MIKVEHLTKCYGDFVAVEDLSFEIEEGHVYGFLGPNGAGKSTTMNILTGCLSATDGKVNIGGYDIFEEPEKAKKLIGYLPEQPPLYLNETPLEYLEFVGEAKGIKGEELQKQIEDVIEKTGLCQVKHRLISALSKGYRQRVGIAQALLGNPRVIILDEPTVGLDPIQIIEIRDLIKKLGESHTVIFSSHILSEVQTICEQVLIIAGGKLAAFDTPKNLENILTKNSAITLRVLAKKEEIEKLLEKMEQVTEYECQEEEKGSVLVTLRTKEKETRKVCCDLFYAFAEGRMPIYEMNTKKANLEEVFIELTEGEQKEKMEAERKQSRVQEKAMTEKEDVE